MSVYRTIGPLVLLHVHVYCILLIGYSTVFCKIRDFICTSLRSTEMVLASDSESNAISVERRRVQIKSSILPNTVE